MTAGLSHAETAPQPYVYETVVVGHETKAAEPVKTSEVNRAKMESKSAHTVIEALRNESGVDVQTTCANCGAKRVTLNGLRGEHTTILVDGIPLQSSLSALYGLDAIPVAGVESVEISRGTGAAQLAPEAIGGVINIVTQKARGNDVSLIAEQGTMGVRSLSGVGTWVSPSASTRAVLALQSTSNGFWDLDHNLVSEFPETGGISGFLKLSHDLSSQWTIEGRYAYQALDTLGGTTTGFRPVGPRTTFTSNVSLYNDLFPNGDVRLPFKGDSSYITDQIQLHRHEATLGLTDKISSDRSFRLRLGAARQAQDSIYMHGYDYSNIDQLGYLDSNYSAVQGPHWLTLGIDTRLQVMNSSSVKLYDIGGIAKDSFRYRSHGVYAQDIWTLGDGMDLSVGLRIDSLILEFLGRPDSERFVRSTLLSPRVLLHTQHDAHWSSDLSYGRGYRAPLSFLESQHGLSERGFETEISEIETSHSLGGQLSRNETSWAISGGAYLTWLKNMAYAETDVPIGSPVVFRNVSDTFLIQSYELGSRVDLTSHLSVDPGFEVYRFPDGYSQRLPSAAVETRARLLFDYHVGDWEAHCLINWIGPRDLTRYGYANRFDTLTYIPDPLDPSDPTFAVVKGLDRKNSRAPGFVTVDLSAQYRLSAKFLIKLAVLNATDYTQTGAGTSPLSWNQHGTNPEHFHLDNNYLWGPIRGRIWSASLRADL